MKTIILLLLFLFPFCLHAQQRDTLLYELDTSFQTPIEDTISSSVPATDEETDEDGDENYAEEKGYTEFIPRYVPGSELDSFHPRRINANSKDSMHKDEDFWYANMVFKKEKKEPPPKSGNYTFLQPILWLLIIGGFITFLVIYLSNSNVGIFRKSHSIVDLETNAETDDIFAINYQREIDKVVSQGNYRLAVRLLFLRTLRHLSEKNLIQYASDRTNFDYLLQVNGSPWYQQFFRITRSYEYIWYGQFEIDSEKFNTIKNDFDNLDQQIC